MKLQAIEDTLVENEQLRQENAKLKARIEQLLAFVASTKKIIRKASTTNTHTPATPEG